jgi:hypothetical protein
MLLPRWSGGRARSNAADLNRLADVRASVRGFKSHPLLTYEASGEPRISQVITESRSRPACEAPKALVSCQRVGNFPRRQLPTFGLQNRWASVTLRLFGRPSPGNVTRTPAYHINYLANAVARDEKLAGEG